MEFIVFGEDWGRHPSSSQHIIHQLQAQYPITWINSIGLRQPKLKLRDLNRIIEKLTQRWRQPSPTTPCQSSESKAPLINAAPQHIIRPLVWPLAQHPLLQTVNRLSLKRQLPAKQQPRVIWAALPSAVDYLTICDSDIVIYYCGDDFSALAGVDHQATQAAEQRLLHRADLVFACSPTLQHKLQRLAPNANIQLLPHGVAVSQFATPQSPPDNIDLDTPSVGFYGSIDHWLDITLITKLATARPNLNFYLLGPVNCDIKALKNHRNIHLLPAQPHHQLGRYLQHWSMAILPFTPCPQIEACNPLKLREYLAAGCPVISTHFPALQPYLSAVTVANDLQTWLHAIDHYSNWTPTERQQYRQVTQQLVKNESWQCRAQHVLSQLQPLLLSAPHR